MLSVIERQGYFKQIGMYSGALDGIEGPMTKKAYKTLQDKYFTRKSDRDGLYGPNTEKLLINAYRVELFTKNFDLTEFKCECGGKYCTGYPTLLDVRLLKNLQLVRTNFGPTTITSGLRCRRYNNSLVGSSVTSRHMEGKALDIYNSVTATETGRRRVMAYWKSLPKYNYTYANLGGSHPNMGNAVHVDVE